MASWRIKGYVSDTEDEEDTASIRDTSSQEVNLNQNAISTTRAVQTNAKLPLPDCENHSRIDLSGEVQLTNYHDSHLSSQTRDLAQTERHQAQLQPSSQSLTTTAKLGQSLDEGLRLVRELLSSPQVPEVSLNNEEDSPLSSPPDSPELIPVSDETTKEIVESVGSHTAALYAPLRSFRERTANQLHPYTLEYAQYSKSLVERGLRPVRLLRPPSPGRTRDNEDSQTSQFQDETQNLPESEALVESFTTGMDLPDSHSLIDVTELHASHELPDLSSLLEKQKTPKGQKTSSRTKLKPPANSHQSAGLEVYDLPWSDDEDVERQDLNRNRAEAQAQQDSLPSPPRSPSSDTANGPADLGTITSRSNPAALPTPTTSSALRPRRRFIVEEDSQSAPENEARKVMVSSSSSDTSDDNQNDTEKVRVMQKRVKGVLPASWWSVDRAQKEVNTRKKDTTHRPTRVEQGVGVAQRKSTTIPNPDHISNRDMFQALWSEDEEDEVVHNGSFNGDSGSMPHIIAALEVPLTQDSEAVEVLDEDAVDAMIPSRKRPEPAHHNHRSSLQGLYRENTGSTSRKRTLTRPVSRSYKKHRPKVPSDAVHVLDAPDLQALFIRDGPVFLRLAARQARKRSRKQGTSAAKKIFSLATVEEDMEITSSLRAWQEATKSNKTKRVTSYSVPNRSINSSLGSDLSKSTSHPSIPSRGARLGLTEPNPAQKSTSSGAVRTGGLRNSGLQENGQIVSCGQKELNIPRLTRLHALLPVENRSGRGQLAFRSSGPRAAQVEIPRTDLRRVSMRTLPRTNPISSAESPIQIISHNLQHSPSPAPSNQRFQSRQLVARPRKQRPIQQPKLEQTLLVSSSPNTENLEALKGLSGSKVRNVLEQEFAECQAAWFRGSNSGVSVANARTQQHFQVFLDVLRSYLPLALQDAEDAQETRELQSFLHRLIPNRGQIGARGQVGDKALEVMEYDILVARNVFDLHSCLLNVAPGCAPRPRVLEMKVNFSDAHHEICLVALVAWEEIYNQHHTDPSIIDGLKNWMYSMLTQLLSRWKSAEVDARLQASMSLHRVEEQVVRRVIDHNRSQACVLIQKTLAALRNAIVDVTSAKQLATLFDVPEFLNLLNSICKANEMDEKVIQSTFEIAIIFLKHEEAGTETEVVTALLTGLRQAISMLSATVLVMSEELLRITVEAYFSAAQLSIAHRRRSWDEFFEPRSSLSLDMFVSDSHLEAIKSLFYHFLLEHHANQYTLDFRSLVLRHWLRVLLRHDEKWTACNMLTASIFKHEKDSLSIPTLASIFISQDSLPSATELQFSMAEIRQATVSHVVVYLHGQENNPEAEWLVGGLEESDATLLLQTMFSTMKETWMSLNENPEEQQIYTDLIHMALSQYEAFPRSDFAIESWFRNPATFLQPRKQTLAKLLIARDHGSATCCNAAREGLEEEIRYHRRYGKLQEFESELKNIFVPPCGDSTINYVDAPEVLASLSRIVGVVLCDVLKINAPNNDEVYPIILRVLIYTMDNLEIWMHNSGPTSLRPFVQAMFAVIAFLKPFALDSNCSYKRLIFVLTTLTFEWSMTICEDLPAEFMVNVESICDGSAEDGSEEALLLLKTVMQYV